MSEHVIVETEHLAGNLASMICDHIRARFVGVEMPHDVVSAIADISIELGVMCLNRLKYLGQVIELVPGDRIAKMSDIRDAVTAIVNDVVDKRDALREANRPSSENP